MRLSFSSPTGGAHGERLVHSSDNNTAEYGIVSRLPLRVDLLIAGVNQQISSHTPVKDTQVKYFENYNQTSHQDHRVRYVYPNQQAEEPEQAPANPFIEAPSISSNNTSDIVSAALEQVKEAHDSVEEA
jgi:hypothetical protein